MLFGALTAKREQRSPRPYTHPRSSTHEMTKRKGHKTVDVKLRQHGTVPIDEEIAPLIASLNRRRMLTLQSCQEGWPGLAYIEFASSFDVEEFLNAARRHYRVEVETWDEGEDDELSIRVRLLVIFPTADIPMLTEAFSRRPQKDRHK